MYRLALSLLVIVLAHPFGSTELQLCTYAASGGDVTGDQAVQFNTQDWSLLGPGGGHRVVALAVAPSDPKRLYLRIPRMPSGDSSRHVLFRSDDGGLTWTPKDAGLPLGTGAGLAVDPEDPERVFTGWAGHAVYRSDTGGVSWAPSGPGLEVTEIHWLEIDPSDPATIYAATEEGLYRSDDSGEIWQQTGLRHPTYVVSISSQGTVYAGSEYGLYRSPDGAATWVKLTAGYGMVRSVFVHPEDPNLILIENSVSRDGGESWRETGLDGKVVAADPGNPLRLYAGAQSGLFASSDGGGTWAESETEFHDQSLSLVVGKDGMVYLGTRSLGVFRSTDFGKSFHSLSEGMPGFPVSSVAVDPRLPSRILVGGETTSGIFTSSNGGVVWSPRHDTLDLPTMSVSFGPTGDGAAYAGTYFGFIYSTDFGKHWSLPGDRSSPEARALAVDPSDPSRLYAGARGVYRSVDSGRSWNQRNLGNRTPEVFSLAIDPSDPSIVYAGTAEGFFRSEDHGYNWTHKSEGLSEALIRAVAADPSHPGVVYAATPDGIYKSIDRGEQWTPSGLPGKDVLCLEVDPKSAPGVLYAGTVDSGIYRSLDGGESWQEWNQGLTDPYVLSLAIDSGTPSLVYAGTFSGLFRRADHSALYFAQFGDGESAGTHLRSEIVLLNPRPSSETANLNARADMGDTLPLDLAGLQPDPLELSPLGVRILRSDGEGELVSGSLMVTSSNPLSGTILYSGGTGLAGVGSGLRTDVPFIAPVLNEPEARRTALALMNLVSRTVHLTVQLRTESGNLRATGEIEIPPDGHLARFLDELNWESAEGGSLSPVAVRDFKGSIELEPDGRVAAILLIALPQELATLPVIPATANAADSELIFPQFADGIAEDQRVSSRILLLNPSLEESVEVEITLRDGYGLPLPTDLASDGRITQHIPPAGIVDLASDGLGQLQTGSVRVVSNRPIGGLLLFEGTPGSAGVSSAAALTGGFLIPVDQRQGVVRTGLALANPSAEDALLDCTLRSSEGETVASAQLLLSAFGQLSHYVDELEWNSAPAELTDFLGSLECQSETPVSAVTIQTRPGQYATMPVFRTD